MTQVAEKAASLEETPAGKLAIETISTITFKTLINILASQDIVLAVWGPSGIGKSAIPMQVAKEREAPYVPLHMPTMTPEDFHIPSTATDTRQYYDRRIPRRFKIAIDYVEQMKAKHNGVVPPDKRPIIAVEELNRAIDKSVTRGAFVLLGDRQIGDTVLDESFQFVVSMNPTGGGMSVNEFERDPAMRRRLCSVYMAAEYRDFIRHAEEAAFHPEVVGYLRAHPSQFYDTFAAKGGKVFACPATWDKTSRVAKAFDLAKHPLTSSEARAAFAGYVGVGIAETFLEFIRDRTTTVTPDDIIGNYSASGSDVRKRVKAMLSAEGGKLDRMMDLITGLTIRIYSKLDGDATTISKQIATFMSDLPEELLLAFIQQIARESKQGPNSDAARKWMQKLNGALNKESAYAEALKRYHAAKDRGKDQAKADNVDLG